MATLPFYSVHDNMGRDIVIEDCNGTVNVFRNILNADYESKGFILILSIRYKEIFPGWDPSPAFDINKVYCIGNTMLIQLEEEIKISKLSEIAYRMKLAEINIQNKHLEKEAPPKIPATQKQKRWKKKKKLLLKKEFQISDEKGQEIYTYMFFGRCLEVFTITEKILHFISHVGNNDVPYAYAVGKENVYLIGWGVVQCKIKDLIPKTDPYDLYYGHFTENLKEKREMAKNFSKVRSCVRLYNLEEDGSLLDL